MPSYRVVNFSTGEIRAELHDLELAKQLADQLASESQHREAWGVIELVTVYETQRKDARDD
jgi:hypothetical protein